MNEVIGTARYAVEEQLCIAKYFHHNRVSICASIEAAGERAFFSGEADPTQIQVVAFFTECLPFAARLVCAGSSGAEFRDASIWARHTQPSIDPVSLLAMLSLIYLMEMGTREASRDFRRASVWQRIHRQVDSYWSARTPADAPTPMRCLKLVQALGSR
jgi:hypothetical protein